MGPPLAAPHATANLPTQSLARPADLDVPTQAGIPLPPHLSSPSGSYSPQPPSGELPATTPFAWTAEPAPARRSALPLVLGAGLVLALAAVGAFVALRPAAPVRTTFGVSPLPMPTAPVVAPAPPTAVPIVEVPSVEVPSVEVPSVDVPIVDVPIEVPSVEVPIATAPGGEAGVAPTTAANAASAPAAVIDAGRATSATRRPADPDAPRPPRRGTGGAFILH